MKPTLPIIVFLSFSFLACTTIRKNTKANRGNQSVVDWSSPIGIERLASSKHKTDFFKLANHFEGQSNKIFCGPTSAAIVLNALRIRRGNHTLPQDKKLLSNSEMTHLPKKDGWTPFYSRYTQHNVFNRSPKSKLIVLGKPVNIKGASKKDFGFQIRQFAELLEAHDLKVNLKVVGNSLDTQTLKSEMIQNLKTADDYLIVNYKRSVLDQPGGGHISPVGAYHAPSDSFLILDVTPNKANWVWVQGDLLVSAMRTLDTHENRGYVMVKDNI